MRFDSAWTQDQSSSDLGIRVPSGDQSQYFQLSAGEAAPFHLVAERAAPDEG